MKYLFKVGSRSLRCHLRPLCRHPREGGDPEKTNNANGLLQQFETAWIPAFAGMTGGESGMTAEGAVMTTEVSAIPAFAVAPGCF